MKSSSIEFTEFQKAAITPSHDCKFFLKNLCKCCTDQRKTGKSDTNFMYLSLCEKVFLVSYVFFVILYTCFCAIFQLENIYCAKEFGFKKTVNFLPLLSVRKVQFCHTGKTTANLGRVVSM